MASEPTPVTPPRPESREVVELRRLRESSPHLAAAIDFQLAILETQRLMQVRVPLPHVAGHDALLSERLAAARRLVEFDDIAFEWSDTRRLVRDAAEVLLRFELIEREEANRTNEIVRDAAALPALLRRWYDAPVGEVAGEPLAAAVSQICLVAMRPYLARCAAAMQTIVQGATGARVSCPVCSGEADFTVWSASGRSLVCARCTGRWPFPEEACAFCAETTASARKTFASGSRTYRVEACERCRRYMKGFDERGATRHVILSVDTIATLPLDAAALQLGFE